MAYGFGQLKWSTKQGYRGTFESTHWSQEETADTYTREHSNIIPKIWTQVFEGYSQTTPR